MSSELSASSTQDGQRTSADQSPIPPELSTTESGQTTSGSPSSTIRADHSSRGPSQTTSGSGLSTDGRGQTTSGPGQSTTGADLSTTGTGPALPGCRASVAPQPAECGCGPAKTVCTAGDICDPSYKRGTVFVKIASSRGRISQ